MDDNATICTFDQINANSNSTSKTTAAIITWPRWQTGQTIKIKFLDGNQIEHEKVKEVASEWLNYANLNFEYVSDGYADIRIGFERAGENGNRYGAWSDLGMKSAYGNTNHQSMRLGPLSSIDEASTRRTILHEFGHALGLFHETTNPAANIQWDLPKTYQYYSSQFTKYEVDNYIINKENTTDYSEYDPLSIMHYYIPASITKNKVAVYEQNILSEIDKQSINKWYPFPARSIINSGERIDFIPWTQTIKSPNEKYQLLFFHSGSLCIFDLSNNTFIWEAGDGRYYRSTCKLETNGNLVLEGARTSNLSASKVIIWTSNTSEFPGAKLYLQNDGDLQLIYNGVVKWSSKNGKM
ncbi:hypothetical protein HYN56_10235 [Flavobacterium crocinum]|uniref:Bulb-type lectin domain-containing protein n=1 Tax=Flavobacterium crocinum TaxID=2183896 RepID=A0A2S1YKI0_9FLAO|nr:M12 family metallopeptidase [Flavobacterium crocinum]AWK04584.1 hypothetical protein HYN56_10235 [Flavobacterium crocinum]